MTAFPDQAATSAHSLVFDAVAKLKGTAFARRMICPLGRTAPPTTAAAVTPYDPAALHTAEAVHSSHAQATAALAQYQTALGPAYPTLHLIARWSFEHATDEDPAPHLLTTYWTLEEATGKRERTLSRHLVEAGHTWSDVVRQLIDVRHNYGEFKDGDSTRPCIVGTVIRFFPHGRRSPNARVKRWGERNLIEEADAGRTRTCRETLGRYRRGTPRMSAYRPVRDEASNYNWVMIHVGRSLGQEQQEDLANLYADIPTPHVLSALRADLAISVTRAEARGHSVQRARAQWVDLAARVLARRLGDDTPRPHASLPEPRDNIVGYRFHAGEPHAVPPDGFTGLWRRALWATVRGEAAGGVTTGWWHLERVGALVVEAISAGKRNPAAWAWTVVKRNGFEEFMRDYSTRAER